jgi:uncharacterized delta-60 repeat protein
MEGGHELKRIGAFAALLVVTLSVGVPVASAAGATGFLDATFSGDGKVVTNVAGDDSGDAVAIQADGKILVAGSSSGGTDIALLRYTTAGVLDTSFDGDGKVTTDIDGEDAALGIAVAPDQKILVAGTSSGGTTAVVVRYGTDGVVDATFGVDGVAEASLPGGSIAFDIGLQSDGGIVITGFTGFMAGSPQVMTARFDAGGVLDPAFDGDGIVATPLGAGGGIATGLAVQADDKVVVAGTSLSTSSENVALLRYDTDGSLDASFGNNGRRTTDVGPGPDEGSDVVVQPDGKIVVVGNAGFSRGAVLRYTIEGALDASFSGDGKRTVSFGGFDGFRGVGLLGDGRIVAIGSGAPTPQLPAEGFAVAQFLADGTSDVSFGQDGKAFVAFDVGFGDGEPTSAGDVEIQSDGRVVAAGTVSLAGSGSNVGVARLGPRASAVIGRPDALIGSGGTFVGDDRYNATGFRQTIHRSVRRGRTRTFQIEVQNDGNAPDSILVDAFWSGLSVKFFDHGVNVTRQMRFFGHREPLAVGASTRLKVVVSVPPRAQVGKVLSIRIGTTSLNVLDKRDVVAAKIKVRA